MARHAGIRRRERRNLDRPIRCYGDAGIAAPITINFSGSSAVRCAIEHIRGSWRRTDLRTGDGKELVAVVQRLERLQEELGR